MKNNSVDRVKESQGNSQTNGLELCQSSNPSHWEVVDLNRSKPTVIFLGTERGARGFISGYARSGVL